MKTVSGGRGGSTETHHCEWCMIEDREGPQRSAKTKWCMIEVGEVL